MVIKTDYQQSSKADSKWQNTKALWQLAILERPHVTLSLNKPQSAGPLGELQGHPSERAIFKKIYENILCLTVLTRLLIETNKISFQQALIYLWNWIRICSYNQKKKGKLNSRWCSWNHLNSSGSLLDFSRCMALSIVKSRLAEQHSGSIHRYSLFCFFTALTLIAFKKKSVSSL